MSSCAGMTRDVSFRCTGSLPKAHCGARSDRRALTRMTLSKLGAISDPWQRALSALPRPVRPRHPSLIPQALLSPRHTTRRSPVGAASAQPAKRRTGPPNQSANSNGGRTGPPRQSAQPAIPAKGVRQHRHGGRAGLRTGPAASDKLVSQCSGRKRRSTPVSLIHNSMPGTGSAPVHARLRFMR